MFGGLFRKSLNIVPTYSRDGCTMKAESVLKHSQTDPFWISVA